MNKTVELVKLWGEYETSHPSDGIIEFCRFQLLKEKQQKQHLTFAKSAMPGEPASVLAKMLGRLGRLLNNYAGFAIRQSGLSGFDVLLLHGFISMHPSDAMYKRLASSVQTKNSLSLPSV